jgi:hypothetical protein
MGEILENVLVQLEKLGLVDEFSIPLDEDCVSFDAIENRHEQISEFEFDSFQIPLHESKNITSYRELFQELALIFPEL